MADKVDKPKKQKAKPKKDEKGVLAALPATRAERIGARRAAGKTPPAPKTTTAKPAAKASATKPAARTSAAKAPAAKASATKPAARTSAAKAPAAKASAAAKRPAASRAAAPPRKAAAPRTFEPTQAAEAAAGAVPLGETPPRPHVVDASYPRPQAVREGAPGMGTTGYREQPSSGGGRPGAAELVTTAVQAAGEVAQIGLSIGGRLVKRAVDRLPRP